MTPTRPDNERSVESAGGARMPDFVHEIVYGSYLKVAAQLHGLDRDTRHIDVARDLLNHLDARFERWPRVVVAGSKGKGSTSAILSSILSASGERVGTITSPQLRTFNERIRIDGQCVSDAELEQAAHAIAPAVHDITSRLEPPRYLGPGGAILALAFHIFAERDVTALVIEAGRGGQHDESSLVRANVSVIAPIMFEHPDKLGGSIEAIAEAKARVAPRGGVIVSASQPRAAQQVIATVAGELGATLQWSEAAGASVVDSLDGVECDLRIDGIDFPGLHLGLHGHHQADNAATAILAARALARFGARCTTSGIYEGVRRVRWPGRGQMVQAGPWVFLDGAINAESARAACEILKLYPAKSITAVVGVPAPKDLDGVCREVSAIARRIITTEAPSPTLTWYEDASTTAARYVAEVLDVTPAHAAFETALELSAPDDGIVLLGTQTFVGSALDFWDVETCSIW